MIKVAAIAIDGCYASSVTGFIDLLQIANAYAQQQGTQSIRFEWEILSISGKSIRSSTGFDIGVNGSLFNERSYDLIYIPGIFYPGKTGFNQLLNEYQPLYPWLIQQWNDGAILAANCTGTFLLGETKLLNDRQATTTWWLEKQFKTRYPAVNIDIKQLITEDQRIVCAGAIGTYQQLALHMVKRFISPSIASLCAKALLVDLGQTQTPYLRLTPQSDHNDKLVSKAEYYLQQHQSQSIQIKALADQLAVSHRTLIRRFNSALGKTPLGYLQDLRIDTAKTLLETTDLHIEVIMLRVGYEDISSFSRLFKEKVGSSPSVFRERFCRR